VPSIFFVLLPLLSVGAQAHPGGLNSEGCHNNRKTGEYHCHRGSAANAGAPKQAAVPERSTPPTPGTPTCYTGPRGGTYTITKSGRKNYSGC
jgi:hypothetical protein